MDTRVSDIRDFCSRVLSDISEKNVTFMAAGLAYNALISLAPMLLLLFLVLSVIGGGLEARIVDAAGNWLPGPIAEVVRGLFQGDPSVGGASFIGLVVLLWGTLKIFRGLDTAFSEIYETKGANGFADKMKDATVVFGALLVAIVATIGTSAVFAVLSDTIPFVGLLTPLVLLFGLVIAFIPIYYVFPDTDVELRGVMPGVLFAAIGWAAFQGLFQVYLAFKDPGAGSFFGGVLLVVTYLYFSGLVLLIGAVINAVAGGYSSGTPGGVGRGAGRAESLNRSEVAAYLLELRDNLTGESEESHFGPEGRPRPDADVRVTERSSRDGDSQHWTVTLDWEGSTDSRRGSESDGSRRRTKSDD